MTEENLPDELILYSPKQLSEILHLRVDTIHKKLASGQLPGRKTERKWYTSKKELLEYLANNPQKPPENS